MSLSNPGFSQQQPLSEEEVVFRGRADRRRQPKKERVPYRTSIPDSRSSPPYMSGSGSSSYRGERGGRSRGGGVPLPPRPRTPETWGSSYRGDGRGGRYGDSDREGQGWYEDLGRGRRNDSYRASGYESVGYRNAEPARSVPERDARNPQRDYCNHGNNSVASSGAVRSQLDAIYGNGSTSGRNDHYRSQYYSPPPPVGYERERTPNYHNAPSAHQQYDRYQAPERAYPPPRGSWDHPPSLPQRPSGELNYRSDNRQPPLPRGPLSSSRFNQGIDKNSRYSSPSAPATSSTSNKQARGLAKKARKREAALLNPPPSPPPHRRFTTSPPPPIPPSKTILPIPEPTDLYLTTTLLPSPRLTTPTRHLLILDLNGTLLAREKGRSRSGSLNPTPRPGLDLFLSYIFTHFSVMVWSSAQPENVRLMVRALFTEAQERALLACWGRDTLGLTKAQFMAKTQVYKRLERVWTGEYEVVHHTRGMRWDQTNTLLLDDSSAKARGQPWNHVEVPEFLGSAREKMEDRALWALVGYLEECRWRGNVSAFVREVPFEVGGEWEVVGEEVLRVFEGGEVGRVVGELEEGEEGVRL